MLIHSVTPPHMLIEQPEYPAVSCKQFSGGFVEGIDTPQGFCMSRLCSTDPSLYLKAGLSPGSIFSFPEA